MELIITIVGTVITAIGTTITVIQAIKVKKYKAQIMLDVRKINIYEIIEQLKKAQDGCRKLKSEVRQMNRGKNSDKICMSIQGNIDSSVALLHLNGPDCDIRKLIVHAQDNLANFDFEDDPSGIVSKIHASIQDAISLCKEHIDLIKAGG